MKRFFTALFALALAVLPAHGDLLMTGVGSGNGSVAAPASLTFCSSGNNSTAATTITFTAISSCAGAKFLVACFVSVGGQNATGATFATIAMTQITNVNGVSCYGINSAATSGDLAVTYSASINARYGLWAAYNLISTTPVDVQTATAPTTTTTNTTVATSNQGVAFFAAAARNASLTTATWGGTVTKDWDGTVGSSGTSGSGASNTTTGANLTGTVTQSASISVLSIAGMSFR